MPGTEQPVPFAIESLGANEQRISFRVGDSWCRSNLLELKSGVRLDVTACQFAPTFAFAVEQPPAELTFLVSKGDALEVRTGEGDAFRRGGNTLQVGRNPRPLALHIRPTGDKPAEVVSVTMSGERLRELLGGPELPRAFADVLEKHSTQLVSRPMSPRLFRLLDEIANSDVRGPGRTLWHEAKSLELIAVMTDEFVEAACAEAPILSTHELERLERVRKRLVERLESTPTLGELAKLAGFSETKLKGNFRTLFGTSIFSYLRQARMNEARRLIDSRQLNVTEIAQRVGYANPSKFAAAFRKQFGTSPSAR